MLQIKTLHSIDTEYSADSVEWCPYPEFNEYFACGTYQLGENDKETNITSSCSRKGRIYLYKFDPLTKALNEVDRLETPAILDMKWIKSSCTELPLLATANALGQIEIYVLENIKLNLFQSIDLANSDNEKLLVLSLDWSNTLNSSMSENLTNEILASDSKGNITLLSLTNERGLQKIRTWTAHLFEAWICAFDKWDHNKIYTGGDDTFLHVYDLRMENRISLNKSHSAGVTCLLSHPKREYALLSGSYDDKLRTFDTRFMKQPLGEINLSGGIWRLKSHPIQQDMILTACMYHNFSLVDLSDLLFPKLVGEYFEHKSICYGADWCFNSDDSENEFYMATCSFYDHKLCLSSVKEVS